jgi:hypothetical protein
MMTRNVAFNIPSVLVATTKVDYSGFGKVGKANDHDHACIYKLQE